MIEMQKSDGDTSVSKCINYKIGEQEDSRFRDRRRGTLEEDGSGDEFRSLPDKGILS